MTQITVLNTMRYTDQQLDKLRAASPRLEVLQHPGGTLETLPDDVIQRTEVLYGWGGAIHQAHHFPRLKWIQSHSAGINDLHNKPVWQTDVTITTMSGIHAVPMAEFCLGMMMALSMNVREMIRLQSNSSWGTNRWDTFSRVELRGSTLGLIGYGTIAREIARQVRALGMDVVALNRSGQRTPSRGLSYPGVGDPDATIPRAIYPITDLLDVLPQCDYVVILAPYTPATHHLIGAAALAAMKSSAILVNLARGPLLDEAALVHALQQGQIAGAGLDVFEQEPLPSDSPLWPLENVIISPHVSGMSLRYDERASDVFAENLRRYANGEPLLNLVDRQHGY